MAWLHSGIFVLAALLGGASETHAATQPDFPAGTYAVRLCHGSCSERSSLPFRTGIIVLFRQPVRDRRGRKFRAWLDRESVNACFVLKPSATRPAVDDYIPKQGFFSWAARQADVEFELERSPDGGYRVSLEPASNGLVGVGSIWGGAVGPVTTSANSAPQDSVVAERIGEPDISQCPRIPANAVPPNK